MPQFDVLRRRRLPSATVTGDALLTYETRDIIGRDTVVAVSENLARGLTVNSTE